MRTRQRLLEYTRRCTDGRMPGQRLKRKTLIVASIIFVAAFDWFFIVFGIEVILPHVLDMEPPYLPKKYAQAYTHVTTLRDESQPSLQDGIHTIAFSPDGKTLATNIAQEVRLWNVNSGKLLSTFKGHSDPVNVVAFSPDGKTVASVSRDREPSGIHSTTVWDPSGKIQKIVHHQMVRYTIRLWDIKTATSRLTFTASISPLTALEFSPDSTKLLIASQNGIIDVYDSTTGHRGLDNLGLFVHDRILNRIGTIAFAASPGDKIITRWIWKTGGFMPNRLPRTEVPRRFTFAQWFMHFRFVAEPGIGLNRGPSEALSFLIPDTYRVSAVAFSPISKILASGGRGREIRLYDNNDGKIQLWDADTGHLLHTFNSPGGWVHLLTFSPDGKMLASTGKHLRRNTIFIWDVENRRLLTTINVSDVDEKGVLTLKFAPDNTTLASGHVNATVQIWDLTGRTNR